MHTHTHTLIPISQTHAHTNLLFKRKNLKFNLKYRVRFYFIYFFLNLISNFKFCITANKKKIK